MTLLAQLAVQRVGAGDAELAMGQHRHVAAHCAQGLVHRRSIDGRRRITFDGHLRSVNGRCLGLHLNVDGHCVSTDGHRVRLPVARKLGHLAESKASIEAAHHVHRVALCKPARGSQLELLARLEQPQLAARHRRTETKLIRDAGEHGRGSVIAAHAVERAVFAAQVPIENLEGRRARLGHCRLGCKRYGRTDFAMPTSLSQLLASPSVVSLERAIASELHQQRCALWLVVDARLVERRAATRVSSVEVCASCHELLDRQHSPARRRHHQRRHAVTVCQVWIRAMREQ